MFGDENSLREAFAKCASAETALVSAETALARFDKDLEFR